MTCANAWCNFEQDVIDATIDQWHDRLRSYVRAGGGHFEHMLEMNIHLYDSPENFVKLPMYFDAFNGYFVLNITSWICV